MGYNVINDFPFIILDIYDMQQQKQQPRPNSLRFFYSTFLCLATIFYLHDFAWLLFTIFVWGMGAGILYEAFIR